MSAPGPPCDLAVPVQVRVELVHNPDLCSPSSAKQRHQQVLKVKAESSRTVSFVIVPLKLGLLDIEVKAAVHNLFVGDGVKKKLRVVVSAHGAVTSVPEVSPPR